jgi:hypothetical protein
MQECRLTSDIESHAKGLGNNKMNRGSNSYLAMDLSGSSTSIRKAGSRILGLAL